MKQSTQRHLTVLLTLQYLHYFKKTKEADYLKEGKIIILSDTI